MFQEISLLAAPGSRRNSPGGSTAEVRCMGQDIDLESRVVCSTTNITISGSQVLVNGEASRLIMYGAYGLIEPGFHHRAFFDSIRPYNVNAVRIWINFHWANELSPFARSGVQYDLKSWSNWYFDRLRDFVQAADERGIVVQVCLFDGVMLETSSENRWNWSPYNDARNLDNTRYIETGSRFSEYFTTSGRVWTEVNRPLIRRVVNELGGFGNVIYEVMNEPTVIDGFNSASNQQTIRAFHAAVAAELKSALANKTGSKIVSVNVATGDSTIDDTDTLYAWARNSSNVDMLSVHLSGNGDSQAGLLNGMSKPVIISNDGHESCETKFQSPNYGTNKTRAQLTHEIAARTFQNESADKYGSRHFEFLDLGLYGNTHGNGNATTAPNYDARADRVDNTVLRELQAYGHHSLINGMRITLKASNGQYLCAEGGGGGAVVANRSVALGWETFEVVVLGEGRIALKAANGQFLCAEGGGGREVVANRGAIGGWETFKVVRYGVNRFALQAANGQYLCAEGGGGGEVVANRDAIGGWELFEFNQI